MLHPNTRRSFLGSALAALFAGPALASAEGFPSRTVRIVVPFAPGASADMLARIVGERLAQEWKQSVVIDNRPGAGGMLGSDHVAKSAPDGYTLLLGTDGTHAGNPWLIEKHPFHPLKDVTPLTLAAAPPLVLVVQASHPANSLADYIRLAKEQPGKMTFASSGNGSPHHLAGEMLNHSAGIQVMHVPYKGGGAAFNDLMGGHVDAAYATLVTVLPAIKQGRLKALAVAGSQPRTREQALPQVPTVAEVVPGFEMSGWLGFFAPGGLPADLTQKINASLVRALNSADIKSKLNEAGLNVVASSAEEFATRLARDFDGRGKLIAARNIKLN